MAITPVFTIFDATFKTGRSFCLFFSPSFELELEQQQQQQQHANASKKSEEQD
jgi:hypothetical protein